MDAFQKVLFVDATTGYYKMKRYKIGDYFGPVDLGIHLADNYETLNVGVGILAGSIFPGSNRLIFTGFSPSWRGFYISSMGGAGLVFDNLGINMLSIGGKAPTPSVLFLNRTHGEEIEVEILPVDANAVWKGQPEGPAQNACAEGGSERVGVYSMTDWVYKKFGERYQNDPRILVTGPAALYTDSGGICSMPIANKKISYVDTWAGRGGLGSNMAGIHGIVAVIYGGTVVDEDFRDRKVADEWFENKYKQKLAAKDFEATTKYRFDPKWGTGGTLGVNYATIGGRIMALNYRTIYDTEDSRLAMNEKFVISHYLKQFNEDTIAKKQQFNCGEPCSAVCKKMNGPYKKDYEPYQTMGPLCGIFDQAAAEKLNHHCDAMGFDAISMGGVVAWLMELLWENVLSREDLGVTRLPKWNLADFDPVTDSMHNAELGIELFDAILEKRGVLDLSQGVRKWARRIQRERGVRIIDKFVFTAFGRKGWMVPNQYWTPGVLAPMPIMGKYYMYYGNDFMTPRRLGKHCAERMKAELVIDNLGVCRFHRAWAEDMLPDIVESIYQLKDAFLANISVTASRINSRNAGVYWESERDTDYVYTFLKRLKDVEKKQDPELDRWIAEFEKDKKEAALSWWFEMRKGIDESLRDFL
jgi:glyceraldehyde-3-phosphate dehydrogenase (ferredoxin)